MKDTSITISKEKLVSYLIRVCPERRGGAFGDNGQYCQSLMDNECKAQFVVPKDCPWDCPHLYTESTRCKGEKCKRIKKTLKEIL